MFVITLSGLFSFLKKLFLPGERTLVEENQLFIPINKKETINIEIVHQVSSLSQNVIEFWFKSNAGIRIKKVDVSMGESRDEINGDLKTEYEKDQWYLLAGYETVKSENEWIFVFTGVVANTDISFSLKVNYLL